MCHASFHNKSNRAKSKEKLQTNSIGQWPSLMNWWFRYIKIVSATILELVPYLIIKTSRALSKTSSHTWMINKPNLRSWYNCTSIVLSQMFFVESNRTIHFQVQFLKIVQINYFLNFNILKCLFKYYLFIILVKRGNRNGKSISIQS